MGLSLYQYKPLQNNEIRVLELAPGKGDDVIRFTLTHIPLLSDISDAKVDENPRQPIDQLKTSVSEPWEAHELVDGRYLFTKDDGEHTTWEHPDPNIPQHSYRGYPLIPKSTIYYEALSYVWGSTNNPVTAFIHSSKSKVNLAKLARLGGGKCIEIGQNLAIALQHLRQPGKWRTLWVDAICIDQNNVSERNAQISRMADVYSFAHQVVVWLGQSADDSSKALSAFASLGGQFMRTKGGKYLILPEGDPSLIDFSFRSETNEAINKLFEREYFLRLWVCQEIQLAGYRAIVHCGFTTVPWMSMKMAVQMLENNNRGFNSRFGQGLIDVYSLTGDAAESPLEFMLAQNTWRRCQDPRDKVFGLVGLMPLTIAGQIEPNYKAPVSNAYLNLFLAYMRSTNRLDLLIHCNALAKKHSGPSWVPDWSEEIIEATFQGSLATGVSPADALHEGNILSVKGLHVGTIECLTEPLENLPKAPSFEDIHGIMSTVHQDWEPLATSHSTPYLDGRKREDAFLSMLRYGQTKEKLPTHKDVTFAEWKADYEINTSNAANARLNGMRHNVDFVEAVVLLPRARFAILSTGHFGLVAKGAKKGDHICAVLGCSKLLILRPEEKDLYSVIGTSYFEGLASGEAIVGPFPSKWSMQFVMDESAQWKKQYFNTETEEVTSEDPRLWKLSDGWENLECRRTREDPMWFGRWRNTNTGEVRSTDPRLSADELKKNGVVIEDFTLI